jgi:hypothetical protein
MVDGWGLIDIWDVKHKQEYGQTAHTWYSEQEAGCSARLDYAMCNEEFMPFVKGIRLDKVQRILGTDHRMLVVDICNTFWAEQEDEYLQWEGDEVGYKVESRVQLGKVGSNKAESEQYRKVLEQVCEEMEEAHRQAPQQMVYSITCPNRVEHRDSGDEWELWTMDPMTAAKWAFKKNKKGTERGQIQATTVEHVQAMSGSTVDVSTEHLGKARGIRNPKLNKYVQQKVVMVRRGEQTHTEKVALHDPLVVLEVEEWAAAVQELYPKQREEGIQGWLDSSEGQECRWGCMLRLEKGGRWNARGVTQAEPQKDGGRRTRVRMCRLGTGAQPHRLAGGEQADGMAVGGGRQGGSLQGTVGHRGRQHAGKTPRTPNKKGNKAGQYVLRQGLMSVTSRKK